MYQKKSSRIIQPSKIFIYIVSLLILVPEITNKRQQQKITQMPIGLEILANPPQKNSKRKEIRILICLIYELIGFRTIHYSIIIFN